MAFWLGHLVALFTEMCSEKWITIRTFRRKLKRHLFLRQRLQWDLCCSQSTLPLLNSKDPGACKWYEHAHTHIHTHCGMHIKHPLLISFTFLRDFRGLFSQLMLRFVPLGMSASFSSKGTELWRYTLMSERRPQLSTSGKEWFPCQMIMRYLKICFTSKKSTGARKLL